MRPWTTKFVDQPTTRGSYLGGNSSHLDGRKGSGSFSHRSRHNQGVNPLTALLDPFLHTKKARVVFRANLS